MLPNVAFFRLRPAVLSLAGLIVVLAAAGPAFRWLGRPPAVDAEELVASQPPVGDEVIVTGEWLMTMPSVRGHVIVVLRGAPEGRIVCHFEDVRAADRGPLETRLLRHGRASIRGRYEGVEGSEAILRGCRLLD